MTWRTWAACGNPKWLTVTALRVRSSTRPWARSRVRSSTGTLCQGRWPQRANRVGVLIGLDGEQVVGLLCGHHELGRAGVGVQRVGGDHRAGQLQAGQQWGERGDLAGVALEEPRARDAAGVRAALPGLGPA